MQWMRYRLKVKEVTINVTTEGNVCRSAKQVHVCMLMNIENVCKQMANGRMINNSKIWSVIVEIIVRYHMIHCRNEISVNYLTSTIILLHQACAFSHLYFVTSYFNVIIIICFYQSEWSAHVSILLTMAFCSDLLIKDY